MRKHSKLITVLLSVVLAVSLMLTVFIQAFASEMDEDDYGYGNVATGDEAEEYIYPVSMEVVNAPESVTVLNNKITDSTFWSNVVLHIVYSNGEEYDVNCDGIESDDGIVPPIAEINGYTGNINVGYWDYDDDTVNLTVEYYYDYGVGYEVGIYADFSVKRIDDPHAIVGFEVTKLPDKVFTAPLFTGSRKYVDDEEYEKWVNSLDVNNSIANNIDGMEVTYYYANGESITVAFNSSMMGGCLQWYALYNPNIVDEYGNYFGIQVIDEGDYKFSVSDYANGEYKIYTAKSTSNPNPSINGESTSDTPAKPSGNNSSATSDVATKDNANNSTANNGVVATGDFATSAIIAVVMLSAVAFMFVFKRKRMF